MNAKTRSIHIFLNDGEPEGLRSANIPLHSIVGVAFKDVQLAQARQIFDKELARSGVYVLIGRNNEGKQAVYIGESEKISERLQYQSGKNAPLEWTDALAFVSNDETLTKGHVRFAEAELIAAAKANPHWDTSSNVKEPSSAGKLPKPDEYFMREFVEQVKTLAGALGCAVFKPVSGKPKQSALFEAPTGAQLPPMGQSGPPLFQMEGNGYAAKAVVYVATGEFSVLQGSRAKLQASGTIPSGAQAMRAQLQADGVLAVQDGGLIFTMDYGFASTSAAAAVVCGNSTAGPTAWRLTEAPAITYKQWLTQQQDGPKSA